MRSLTTDSAKTLVHALIASRLDYCNSVFYQINTTATTTLQSVLHPAAGLIVQKRKFECITLTLRDDLHWLPVWEDSFQAVCDHLHSSSVAIKPLRSTSRSCAYQLLLVQVVATYTLRRSWRFASASLPHFQFWTTQLCCLCSKTVELSATVTSWSNTDSDTIL